MLIVENSLETLLLGFKQFDSRLRRLEDKEPFSEPSINSKIKQAVDHFSSTTPMYGLTKILNSKRPNHTVVWSLFILLSACIGLYIIVNNTKEYLQYEFITKTSIVSQSSEVLPAITFCPSISSNAKLQLTAAYGYIGTGRTDFKDLEHEPESDCIRFNGYQSRSQFRLETLKDRGFYYTASFLIRGNSSINVYITDNYLNSFEKSKQVNLDFNNFYQISLAKSVHVKLEAPYNPCATVLDPTYRFFNCKFHCIHRQVEAGYNCSTSFRSFVNLDEARRERCILKLTNESESAYRKKSFYFFDEMLEKFGPDCERECPKECTRIQYSAQISVRRNSTSRPIDRESTLFSFYFEDFDYNLTSEVPKVSSASLWASIVGALGFFFGLKFLSFIEFGELLFKIAYFLCF